MTVAIGILTPSGIVIAADRQQTEGGSLKSDQRKISGGWSARPGWRGGIFISGAGDGPYIDALSTELTDWFSSDTANREAPAIENEIKKRHEAFYHRYVLPFSNYPSEDRPDYDLLVATSLFGSEDSLWTTHKLVVNREGFFAAVGIGATAAKALLTKLYVPFMPAEIAISLAAYVVFQVKRTIDLVGLETDIYYVRGDMFPLVPSPEEILEMENRFRSYDELERSNLYYCLGGDIADVSRMHKKSAADRLSEIRNFFDGLNNARAEQLAQRSNSKKID